MSDFTLPVYNGLPSICAGLERMSADLYELGNQAGSLATRPNAKPCEAAECLLALRTQLAYLAAETEAMRTALGKTDGEAEMAETPPKPTFTPVSVTLECTPVITLYNVSNALTYLAETMPDENSGLAKLLDNLGADVQACAQEFDDNWVEKTGGN